MNNIEKNNTCALIIIIIYMSSTKSEVESTEKSKAIFVRNRTIASALILIANFLGFLHLIPVFPQLLINSCCCVYLGTIMSTKLKRSKDNTLIE